jgi:hypothetical protein
VVVSFVQFEQDRHREEFGMSSFLILFMGGLCLLTGAYGLYTGGSPAILVVAVAFGSGLIGVYIGENSRD